MLPWRNTTIRRPVECPSCRGDVWVPQLRAYRYAAGRREHAGDVAQCAACGCVVTLLRDGGVVRMAGARAAAARPAEARPPGGQATGRPGELDPDMVTLDAQWGLS